MDHSFANAYKQYVRNISTIREFFEQLHPLIESGQEESLSARLNDLAKTVGRDVVEGLVDAFTQSFAKVDSNDETKRSEDRRAIHMKLLGGLDPRLVSRATPVFNDIVRQTMRHAQHPELLNQSVLVSLVGFYEVLISDLLHVHYRLHPDAAGSDEKLFSFRDVARFKNMDEFVDDAIDRKIDAFLRNSAAEWTDFFDKRLNIGFDDAVPDKPSWYEYFQRRHIIIHNGSRVSKLYLQKVDPAWIANCGEDLALDRHAGVSAAYIAQALDDFETVGSLLCQKCWNKFSQNEREQREEALVGHQHERVRRSTWGVVENLGSWAVTQGNLSAEGTLTLRIHRWLAIKRQDRWAEIEKEVREFDRSALPQRFLLALYALMDDTENFFKLLPVARNADVSEESLKESPIFDEMRQRPEFEQIMNGGADHLPAPENTDHRDED